jgi:putative aldouronate transport system substrate-binding protein
MKKGLFFLLTGMLTVSTLTGCKKQEVPAQKKLEVSATGFPIVNEKITLKFMVPRNAENVKSYAEMDIFKKYEEKTNIHIEWEEVADEAWQEKYKLVLASQNLPDAFAPGNTSMDSAIVANYGKQGMIVPMESLIEKVGINTKKFFSERNDLKKLSTYPDGHIYGLPYVDENMNLRINDMLFLNNTWLKKLNLPVPTTIDEFADYLRKVKAADLNGNAKKDEIPLSFASAPQALNRLALLFGSFGVIDASHHVFIKPDGKLVYAPGTNEYRQALAYFNNLYKEGLIDPEIFTQNAAQLKAKGKEGIGASIVFWYPDLNDGDQSKNEYIINPPLKGKDGKAMWLRNGVMPGYSPNAFLITKSNKNPEATLRWVDYWLDNGELALTMRFGPKDIGWQNIDGGKWTEVAKTPTGEARTRKIASQDSPYGQVIPFWQFADLWSKKNITAPQALMRGDGIKNMYYDISAAPYPPVVFDSADNKEMVSIRTDINKYVDNMFAKFLTEGVTDAGWNEYTARLKALQADKWVELHQKYYDLYNKTK